jgi:integrase/recombinase XerD
LTRFAGDTLKGQRDRAILATLLYHGVRREELCRLRVRDLQQREGVLHFRVHGKGDKVRYIPVGLKAQRLITEYLDQVHGKICTRHYNICTEQTYGRL